MNKTQKNIIIVGFDELEERSIGVPKIGDVLYLDNMDEANKHQGYLIIINNKDNLDIISFDKKYRKVLNKYAFIWLYSKKNKPCRVGYCNIELVDDFIFDDLTLNIWDDYERYKERIENKIERKYTSKKLDKLNKLYNFLKDYKIIKTAELSYLLNMNPRTVQRYMRDISNIYHNIGYDYSNNEWYIIW